MTVYASTEIANNVPMPSHGLSDNVKVAYAAVTVPIGFTTTDTAPMFYLPAGARVLYAIIKSADLDTGTTVTLNVGDATTPARYFSAATVAQAATAAAMTLVGGIDFSNTVKTLVSVVPAAGPSTTAGIIELTMFYTIDGVAS